MNNDINNLNAKYIKEKSFGCTVSQWKTSRLISGVINEAKERNMLKTDLTNAAKISTNAMAKLGRNEDVRLGILVKICNTLGCKIDDIVEY